MLSSHRIFKSRLEVGKVLYNIYGDSGLDMWCECTNQKREDVYEEYQSFKHNNNYTIDTLIWFFRQDSPDEFNDWHRQQYLPYFISSLDLNIVNIAKAFYELYKYIYVYDGYDWYQLYGSCWEKTHHLDISKFLIYYTQLTPSYDISKLERMASTVAFRHKLLYEVKPLFKKNIKFNTLYAVKNGVFEVVGNKLIFRDVLPEDYITDYADITYDANIDTNNCITYLCQVFPDENVRDYFLRFSASLLDPDRKVKPQIWLGTGNNSKTTLATLLMSVFDLYISRGISLKESKIIFLEEDHNNTNYNEAVYICRDLDFVPSYYRKHGVIVQFTTKYVYDINPDDTKNTDCKVYFLKYDYDVKRLGPAFLTVITQYYSKYAEKGLY